MFGQIFHFYLTDTHTPILELNTLRGLCFSANILSDIRFIRTTYGLRKNKFTLGARLDDRR